MFTITDYSSAIFVLIVTMLCWGSWPNTQRLTQTHWRFELFYWDYATGLLISALLLAFTLGSVGTNGPDFLTNIQQSDESSIYLALSAGIIFNIGNLLFVAAINYSGMAVAFPVGGGLGLVIGVTTNYFTNPRGDALWLFTGVICILLAMLFTSKAYSVLKKGPQTARYKGIWLAVAAGCFFGIFFRLLAASLSTNLINSEAGKLTPYTSLVVFAVGAFLATFPLNIYIMRNPWQGARLSFKDYLKGSGMDHAWGIIGGTLWCVGLAGSLLASSPAGSAIAFGLSQGNAMIASVWGVFIWKEFKMAGSKVNMWLILLFSSYLFGLTCMILSGTV